jgi:hypothetical protein
MTYKVPSMSSVDASDLLAVMFAAKCAIIGILKRSASPSRSFSFAINLSNINYSECNKNNGSRENGLDDTTVTICYEGSS